MFKPEALYCHLWFRTNNTCLPKVTGRFKKKKVVRYKRVSSQCNENKLGNEYRILFECISLPMTRE